jgi:hypothetical protein
MNMPLNQAQKESRAYDAFDEFRRKAEEVVNGFREAGIPLPPSLKRYLGESLEGVSPATPQIVLPPLPWPNKPPGYVDGWVFVSVHDLLITNLILGILRASSEPMKPAAVHSEAMQYDEEAKLVTVHNVGKRLEEGGTIVRSEEGWILLDTKRAPILFGDFAWGAPESFAAQELASYRRYILLHVLRNNPNGVMVMQAVKAISAFEDYKLPAIVKDTVMDDLGVLNKEGVVERIPATRMWKLAQKGGEDDDNK